MRRGINFIIFLFSIFAFADAEAADPCQTYKLSFKPYASSYLQRAIGPLTELKGDANNLDGDISPAQKSLYLSTSTMQRLDLLMEQQLGKKTTYQAETRKTHYDPSLEKWRGFCDLWTGGASNQLINNLIQAAGTIKCGTVVITKGEVQELMTGFIQTSQANFHGKRNYKEDDEDINGNVYRTSTGNDNFDPVDFDTTLVENLKKDQGVVIDVDPSYKVWNQPVYKTNRCEKDVRAWHAEDEEMKIPPVQYLKARDPETEKTLKQVRLADDLAKGKNYDQAADILKSLYYRIPEAKRFEISEKHPFKIKSDSEYGHFRDWFQGYFAESMPKDIELNTKDYNFKQIENTVYYRMESDFARGDKKDNSDTHNVDGPMTEAKKYRYVQVTDKNNKSVGQFWREPPEKRPDFMWVPPQIDMEKVPQIIKDFIEVVEKCQGHPLFIKNNRKAIRKILKPSQ